MKWNNDKLKTTLQKYMSVINVYQLAQYIGRGMPFVTSIT